MLKENYATKLKKWSSLRARLETSTNPFNEVINFYNSKKRCKLSTNPWDKAIWPGPWELLQNDRYCDLMLTLGSCYTLQLTDRFKDSKFEIHISIDRVNEELLYPLHVESDVLCYNHRLVTQKTEIPTHIVPQRIYRMPRLQ